MVFEMAEKGIREVRIKGYSEKLALGLTIATSYRHVYAVPRDILMRGGVDV